MVATVRAPLLAPLLRLLPARVHDALDAWSRRVALRRMDTRRHRGDRPVMPLPPVVLGRAYLPHPWRD